MDLLSREELEAENAQLRAALEKAGVDVGRDDHDQAARGSSPRCKEVDSHSGARGSRSGFAGRDARQRAIFESATEFAMIVTDPAGVITDWNPGAERAMGWTAAEMRGQDAARFFTPEDQACGRMREEMQHSLLDGRASDERWHMRKDGQKFWASGEMMPLFGADNAHLGYVKILRDRTAEHLAGITLKETQERYRLAVKATNDAIWDWDLAQNRVLWNEALQEAYGHRLTSAA